MQLHNETRLSLGLAAAWVAIMAIGIHVVPMDSEAIDMQPRQARSPFHEEITGFSFQQYGTSGPVTRLQAARLAVVPRKFLFFSIKSVHEVHITNARIETHYYEDDPAETALVPAVVDQITARGKNGSGDDDYREFGLITRVILTGVHAELYQADRLALVLTAETGYRDRRHRDPLFTRAVLENPDATMRIVSEKIIWDPDDKVFRIPGRYVARVDSAESSGKGIKIDLDFTVMPI